MANQVQLLPKEVYVRLESQRVAARVEAPVIPAEPTSRDVPVLVSQGRPGPQGPPGKDGAEVLIDDSSTSKDRVWSSQHTHDNDVAVVESLNPDIDLVLLFDNALT